MFNLFEYYKTNNRIGLHRRSYSTSFMHTQQKLINELDNQKSLKDVIKSIMLFNEMVTEKTTSSKLQKEYFYKDFIQLFKAII